jgi:hypothetical protein
MTEGWSRWVGGPTHYYRNGQSLCRESSYFGADFEGDASAPMFLADCPHCREALHREKQAAA